MPCRVVHTGPNSKTGNNVPCGLSSNYPLTFQTAESILFYRASSFFQDHPASHLLNAHFAGVGSCQSIFHCCGPFLATLHYRLNRLYRNKQFYRVLL